ncbi:MAG TPA: MFS transporter [Chthonomonadaceae bacterium]|nr:MFS transporter [Chthonomonadaceae bacterium]
MDVSPQSRQPEHNPVSTADSATSAPTVEPAQNGQAVQNLLTQRINVRHLLLAIVLVSGCAELAYTVVNISAMPVYIVANGLHPRWVGIAATAFVLVEGILKSPFGVLGDRIGRKALILAGPLVSIFTAALTPHIHNPYVLVFLRLLDGIGAAALWPSAFSLIGDHVPEKKRATAMSLFNLAYLLGIALGPAIGGNVNEWALQHLHVGLVASKSASFYVAAVLFAVTSLAATFLIPHVRPVHHEHVPGVETGFDFKDFLIMLGRMPSMLLMTFITFLGIGLVMAYTKLFAMAKDGPFHLTEAEFGNMLIIPALAIAIASVPLGTLGDRIGKAKAVRLGIGLCVTAYWLLVLFPTVWTLIGLGSLIGMGFVIAFPAWMALVSATCDPRQRGAVMGAVGTAQGLGAIVGLAASSFLYKLPTIHLGPVSIPPHGVPFLGCGVLLLISFLLALFTVHEKGVTREQV